MSDNHNQPRTVEDFIYLATIIFGAISTTYLEGVWKILMGAIVFTGSIFYAFNQFNVFWDRVKKKRDEKHNKTPSKE